MDNATVARCDTRGSVVLKVSAYRQLGGGFRKRRQKIQGCIGIDNAGARSEQGDTFRIRFDQLGRGNALNSSDSQMIKDELLCATTPGFFFRLRVGGSNH